MLSPNINYTHSTKHFITGGQHDPIIISDTSEPLETSTPNTSVPIDMGLIKREIDRADEMIDGEIDEEVVGGVEIEGVEIQGCGNNDGGYYESVFGGDYIGSCADVVGTNRFDLLVSQKVVESVVGANGGFQGDAENTVVELCGDYNDLMLDADMCGDNITVKSEVEICGNNESGRLVIEAAGKLKTKESNTEICGSNNKEVQKGSDSSSDTSINVNTTFGGLYRRGRRKHVNDIMLSDTYYDTSGTVNETTNKSLDMSRSNMSEKSERSLFSNRKLRGRNLRLNANTGKSDSRESIIKNFVNERGKIKKDAKRWGLKNKCVSKKGNSKKVSSWVKNFKMPDPLQRDMELGFFPSETDSYDFFFNTFDYTFDSIDFTYTLISGSDHIETN